MKKSLILLAVCALSVSFAMATETFSCRIRLTSETGLANTLKLAEDDAYTNAYEDGADADHTMALANARSVVLYGAVEEHKCANIVALNLDGTKLGFITNMVDANYTLEFSNVSDDSRALLLYDKVLGTTTTITSTTPAYAFTATAGQVEVADRFVLGGISYAYDVTTNADGYASYAVDVDINGLDGLQVYKGQYAAGELALNEIFDIPANTGVVVKGNPNQTYYLTPGAASSDVSDNELVGCVTRTDVSGISATKYCLRHVDGNGTAFYQYTGAYIPANKAYLPVPVFSGAPARRISIRFGGVTDVQNAEADAAGKAEKFIGKDGQIYIRHNGAVYNLQGELCK